MKNNTLSNNLEKLERLSEMKTINTGFEEIEISIPRCILEQAEELLYELDIQPEIVVYYNDNSISLQYEKDDDDNYILDFTIERNGAITVYTNYDPIEDLSYEEIDLDIDKINEIIAKFYK